MSTKDLIANRSGSILLKLTLTSQRGWETNFHRDTFLEPNREHFISPWPHPRLSSMFSSPFSSFNSSLPSGAACFPFSFTINNSLFRRPQLLYPHHTFVMCPWKRSEVVWRIRSWSILIAFKAYSRLYLDVVKRYQITISWQKESGLTRAFHGHNNGQKDYGKTET